VKKSTFRLKSWQAVSPCLLNARRSTTEKREPKGEGVGEFFGGGKNCSSSVIFPRDDRRNKVAKKKGEERQPKSVEKRGNSTATLQPNS